MSRGGYARRLKKAFGLLAASILLLVVVGKTVDAAVPGTSRVTAITAEQGAEGVTLRISGEAPPTYTIYELFEPVRVVLDIADGNFGEGVQLPMSLDVGPVASISGRVLDDKEPVIARLEMLTRGDSDYTVVREGNDIVVTFKEAPEAAAVPPAEDAVSAIISQAASDPVAVLQQPAPEPEPAANGAEVVYEAPDISGPGSPAPNLSDTFAFGGYNRQLITIDFYMIDLHNVFRLFGEISGLNIVVEEGVAGKITLALNNVPWDFALDIILNLKDLKKEERYNTLVISKKEFVWPEKTTADSVEFKPDPGLVETKPEEGESKPADALSIVETQAIPPEQLEAKKLLRRAREAEEKGDVDAAIGLYEEAFKLWPENAGLAYRIAALNLVAKGQNAKAVSFAKVALQIDSNHREAALLAAIGLANMKRETDAREFFDKAVREGDGTDQPSSEALTSYAMFAEDNRDYVTSLLMLSRHEQLYGDTVDTMVARARIYDKEGNRAMAEAEYEALLHSGYELPADLVRFIRGRLAAK